MELTNLLTFLAAVLPVVYGAPQKMTDGMHPDMLAAMKRDLGLNTRDALDRVARDQDASTIIANVRRSTGDAFAGGWVEGAEVRIGVTDQASAEHVTAAGGTPILMRNSLSKLEKIKEGFDKIMTKDGNATAPGDAGVAARDDGHASISAYFVDVQSNKIVFEVINDDQAGAEKMAADAGLSAEEYEVRKVEKLAVPYAQLQGGDSYGIDNQFLCSVGFAVNGGFISAGHCGKVGSVAAVNRQPIGRFERSDFPGLDMSFVRTDPGTTVSPTVNGYSFGQKYEIVGSQQLERGAAICRSGQTSGVSCGEISQTGVTVQYEGGKTITGLTRTTACSQQGDSGGSFWNRGQAQGVLSGGPKEPGGPCFSLYQPILPILQNYGLTLVTSQGGGGNGGGNDNGNGNGNDNGNGNGNDNGNGGWNGWPWNNGWGSWGNGW